LEPPTIAVGISNKWKGSPHGRSPTTVRTEPCVYTNGWSLCRLSLISTRTGYVRADAFSVRGNATRPRRWIFASAQDTTCLCGRVIPFALIRRFTRAVTFCRPYSTFKSQMPKGPPTSSSSVRPCPSV
jgi:hypothetical protein